MITLSEYGESRIEVKKSVFIGRAVRIRSVSEAEDFIDQARNLYPDARHCCYAWVLSSGTKMQKYSDDGEPSGTAGMPMLSIIEKNDLSDVAVTVTRYFGGVLLGKGGLVRAYSDATIAALEKASPVKTAIGSSFLISCPYDLSEKLIYMLRNKDWQIEDTRYGSEVEIVCVCSKTEEDALIEAVKDKTAGRVIPEKTGEREINCGSLTLF